MRLVYRPIEVWPGKRTSPPRVSPFKSNWSATLALLGRELDQLGVSEAVLQVDNPSETNFRLDGQIRAGARLNSGAVILSFETKKLGKLSYPCDTFERRYSNDKMEDWQHNVRAIALGLEALRQVERYGIANTGQQYTGWQALPPGIALGPTKMTAEEAAHFIANAAGIPDDGQPIHSPALLIADAVLREHLFKTAARKVHPDAGGSTADFQRLQEAKELLDRGGLLMSPERVRCRHGFPSEICPSCAGLGESNPLVSVEAKALNKLSARYAKALTVVEAARGVQPFVMVTYHDPDRMPADPCRHPGCTKSDALKAALAAFDEVEGS